jgi:hypothetical protein
LKDSDLFHQKPDSYGMILMHFRNISHHFKDIVCSVSMKSETNNCQLSAKFVNTTKGTNELITSIYLHLAEIFEDMHFEQSRGKGQHFRVYANIKYEDFDAEIGQLRESISLFFNQIQAGFEKLQ